MKMFPWYFLLFLCSLGWNEILNADEAKELRIGHYSNITHAQAVLAQATGEFDKKIGVPIRWTLFNAGPSEMEALLSRAIDIAYIGPNPAINGYVKTLGEGFRIIAGSASGGAALVIRADAGITSDRDFNNKTVVTPQLGNTQDVAARIWLKEKGYQSKEKGGTVTIFALENPNQLVLFLKKQIDAAWTIEPWVSRLEKEANGKILLEEKSLWPNGEYVTTHIIVRRDFLQKNLSLIKKLIQAHVELTQRLNLDKIAAAKTLNEELKRETGKELSDAVIRSALERVIFTWDPISQSLFKAAKDAHEIGFIREYPNLEGIYDLSLLNQVLDEKRLPHVK